MRLLAALATLALASPITALLVVTDTYNGPNCTTHEPEISDYPDKHHKVYKIGQGECHNTHKIYIHSFTTHGIKLGKKQCYIEFFGTDKCEKENLVAVSYEKIEKEKGACEDLEVGVVGRVQSMKLVCVPEFWRDVKGCEGVCGKVREGDMEDLRDGLISGGDD